MKQLNVMYGPVLDDLLRRAGQAKNQGALTDAGFMAISKAVMALKQTIERALEEGAHLREEEDNGKRG